MSNEENQEQSVEEKKVEVSRGDRGEVGPGTAKTRVLQQWRATHFIRENAQDKQNPNRRIYVRRPDAPSLKEFARQLQKDGDPAATEWFANKHGAKNQKRSDANIKAAKEAGAATMAGRRAAAAKNKK